MQASLGDSVSYTAYGQSATTITGIWNPSRDTETQYDDSKQEILRGMLRVDPADVVGIDDRAIFVIGGVTYAVTAVLRNSAVAEIDLEARRARSLGEGTHRIER